MIGKKLRDDNANYGFAQANMWITMRWHATGFRKVFVMAKSVDPLSQRQIADVVLDLTGLKCPLPVLKARRQVGMMTAGTVLEVIADDPAAPLDFDHFCETSSHRLIASETIDGVFHFMIEVGS